MENLFAQGEVEEEKEHYEHEHPQSKDEHEKKVSEHQITPEEVGKRVVCPVTNEKFRVKKGTRAVEYKGEVYYLCCAKCIRRFSKNPEKYSGKTHQDEPDHHH